MAVHRVRQSCPEDTEEASLALQSADGIGLLDESFWCFLTKEGLSLSSPFQ